METMTFEVIASFTSTFHPVWKKRLNGSRETP